jgi:hypothetical protein
MAWPKLMSRLRALARTAPRTAPPGSPRRRLAGRRSRAALLWACGGYVILHLVFIVWADGFHPGVYDPEYDAKFQKLLKRHAEHPDRPLAVVLGSSRTVHNFRPEILPPLRDAAGGEVILFNDAHTAAGHSYYYLTYRRLVEAGVRPRWLVLEVMPIYARKQTKTLYTRTLVAREFGWFRGHHETGDLAFEYTMTRVNPWAKLCGPILRELYPALQSHAVRAVYDEAFLDLGGFNRGPNSVNDDPEGTARRIRERVVAAGPEVPTFVPERRGDVSLRALLDLCRRHGTRVALVLSPESPAFRLNYTAASDRQVYDYVTAVAAEYGLPFIDARDWLGEADFSDGNHAVYSGQTKFTQRLAADFLTPWLAQP